MQVCKEYEVLIQLALDDLLSPEERQKLTDHLDQCPACRAYYAELYTMMQALSQMEEPVPEELHERIMSGIEQYRKKTEKKVVPFRARRWYKAVAGIAACAVFAVAAARFVPDLNKSVSFDNAGNTVMESAAAAPSAPAEMAPDRGEIAAPPYAPSTEAVTAPEVTGAPAPAPMPESPMLDAQPPLLYNQEITGQMAEDLPPLRADQEDANGDYRVSTVAKWLKVTGAEQALPEWVDRQFIYEAEVDGETRQYVEIAVLAEDYWTDQLTACGFTVEELPDRETVENGEHILLIFYWE